MTQPAAQSKGPSVAKTKLPVLSNSAMACYRRCPREFSFRYIARRRPRRISDALRFGTLFHVGLNAWWLSKGDASHRYSTAVHAMRWKAERSDDSVDPFELVRAEELIRGYTARWCDESLTTIEVEKVFDVPLVNPETGRESRTFRIQGAIDAIARRGERVYQIEHKTTSDDIGQGSDYWRLVSALDPQVSTYQSAMRALGYENFETLYDVVKKVTLRPKTATPEESRKYTQEKACAYCKKAGNVPGPHLVSEEGESPVYCVDGRVPPRLYKGQRETDETPDEYRERVRADIMADPSKYFARGPIVRLERDEREHAADVWQTAQAIRMSEVSGAYPRSPGACRRFHRLCDYFDVCSGVANIEDESRFRTAEHAHEELVKEV